MCEFSRKSAKKTLKYKFKKKNMAVFFIYIFLSPISADFRENSHLCQMCEFSLKSAKKNLKYK